MKNKICCTAVLLFLLFNGYANNQSKKNINSKVNYQSSKYTISGYITENGSGENLIGVSIYVPELKLGTISNDYGFFSLTLPKGKHKVYISYIGYGTQIKDIDLSKNTSLSIELLQSTQSLEEVEVTANKKVQESKVTQMSTAKLNPSIIQDIPALLGEKDVLKTLQLLPGIQGGTEGSSGFFVRGGTPDQNLIILDDATVYNSNHLFGFFSVFNGDAIKSVEAFKGGFPARFGGRLSSVIKIDMKDGNKQELSGKFNIGLISSSLLLEGPLNKGKTSFIFSGRRTYADVLAQPFIRAQSDGEESGGYYFGDLNFKIHHIFSPKDKLYWSNYLGRDNFFANFDDQFGEGKSKLGWGNITSTLRWNHQFNSKLFANTSAIFSNYEFKVEIEEQFNSDDDGFIFSTSSGINDYSLKTDFDYYPNSKHTIRFGAIATAHNFTPQRVFIEEFNNNVNTFQELNSVESAVYLEDDWKITNNLNLSPGARVSYFKFEDKNYLNFEPRLALSYNLKPDLALKASYSNMNQYIHLLSSSGIGLPTDLWVSSTDNVKPQRSEQVAVGIAKDFLDKDYSLTVEGYYKKLNDVIAYREGASFLAIDNLESGETTNWEENITSGQGWAYGAEVLFRKQSGPLTGWLGYTLSWSERQFDELNLGEKFFDRYDRRHDISMVGIYKPHERITWSATWVLSTGNNYTLPNLQQLSSQGNLGIGTPDNIFGRFDSTSNFSTARNNFRGETSHRLDLGVQFHKKLRKNRERTWGLSLYNAYARQNPFIYLVNEDFDDQGDNDFTNDTREKELNRISVLMLIPSFNYTIKF